MKAVSDLDLDLMTAVGRIYQHARSCDFGNDPGLDRLVTCDAPRLMRHVSPEGLAWAAQEGFITTDLAPPPE